MNKNKILIFVLALFVLLGGISASNTFNVDAAEKEIATIYIFADNTSNDSKGTHAWIYIYNYSGKTLNVGGYGIKNKSGASYGTWGNKNEGKGIYINLETYAIHKYGSYSNRVSLHKNITQSDINKINNAFDSYNTWTYTKNCAWFAVNVWNTVSDNKLSAGTIATPAALYNNIKKKNYMKSKGVTKPADNEVYRYYSKSKRSTVSSKSKSSTKSSSSGN